MNAPFLRKVLRWAGLVLAWGSLEVFILYVPCEPYLNPPAIVPPAGT